MIFASTAAAYGDGISIFAKRIAAGQDITIYGDGTQTRDFVYAGDIARGICKAKEGLGWEPEVSLQEGLKRTLAYFSTQA